MTRHSGAMSNDPDFLRKEMMAAGQRLLKALQLEDEFSRLYSEYRQVEVLEQWQKARRLTEGTAEDYARSIHCYFEAVQTSCRRPNLAYPPADMVANGEITPG
jgi:hypothetical protein